MAKGKYQQWLKPEGLEQITNWAAKGLTYEQIAQNMGINVATIYTWINEYHEIDDAIKKGRALSVTCIENMAFKLAMGEATEEVITKVKNLDGSETVVKKVRKLPPNPTMQIFLLKNRANYRDNPPEDIESSKALVRARELLEGVSSVID